jgi:hypothetical protein
LTAGAAAREIIDDAPVPLDDVVDRARVGIVRGVAMATAEGDAGLFGEQTTSILLRTVGAANTASGCSR